MHTKSLKENLQERDSLEDLVVDGRVILEWILERSVWTVQGPVPVFCERGLNVRVA
jgi:hypothetical protein